jgi:hypothetical protein
MSARNMELLGKGFLLTADLFTIFVTIPTFLTLKEFGSPFQLTIVLAVDRSAAVVTLLPYVLTAVGDIILLVIEREKPPRDRERGPTYVFAVSGTILVGYNALGAVVIFPAGTASVVGWMVFFVGMYAAYMIAKRPSVPLGAQMK